MGSTWTLERWNLVEQFYFSTSVVLGEVVGPFLEIDAWK